MFPGSQRYVYIMVYYLDMNQALKHVIHIFLRYWYQDNHIHASKLFFWRHHLIFFYLALKDTHMNKRADSWNLNHLNFLKLMATDSKINSDYYYYFFLMIIHRFCELQPHFFCNMGRVPSIRSWSTLFYSITSKLLPTYKHPYDDTQLFTDNNIINPHETDLSANDQLVKLLDMVQIWVVMSFKVW